TSGDLPISKNLDIEGPGANQLSISGNDASRVFDISGPAVVTINGLTIENGKETVMTEGDGGGGISIAAHATLNLNNCVVTGNQASTSNNTFDVFGGAVFNQGSLT